MDCIKIEKPKKIRINNIPVPKRKKGEALLKVLYEGICGSDLGTYRGTFAYADYPRIPGHEFSAEIVEIDENDKGLKKGMIVTANPYFNCGKCYSCQRGFVNCCENNQTMGAQRDGAFCSFITMPVDRIYWGEGIPAKYLALVEPFCIGCHGIKKANIQKGEKVLIIGAGTIGIATGLLAKQQGAEVHLCDIAENKLEYAKAFHFHQYIINKGDLIETIGKTTWGKGYDAVVEAVGKPETFQNAIDAAAFAGRVVQIGVGKKSLDFDFTILQKKELTVYGSRNARKEDFLEVIGLFKDKKIPYEKLVTHVFPFSQAEEAFQTFDQNGGALKVLLSF